VKRDVCRKEVFKGLEISNPFYRGGQRNQREGKKRKRGLIAFFFLRSREGMSSEGFRGGWGLGLFAIDLFFRSSEKRGRTVEGRRGGRKGGGTSFLQPEKRTKKIGG